MLTKQLNSLKSKTWMTAGIVGILILAGCSGIPASTTDLYGSPAATAIAPVVTQAVEVITQAVPAVPVTGNTPTPDASSSGGAYSDDNPEKMYPTAGAAAADDSAELKVSQTAELGSFLVDENGMTLYLFAKDEPGVSNCSGQCLVKWPPFLTEKAPKADDGVDASKLGTITRDDGTLQVTYDQMPLYYFASDVKAGDTNGQNVGSVWFVVPPTGASSSATSDSADVKVSQNASLGSFLVDSKGMTLYIFTKDAPGVSNCYGECLVNWPALLTTSTAKPGDGVDSSKLGTTKRDDGTLQVTYDNKPLYYFIGDQKAGDTVGQNVGGVWFVIAP